MNNQATLDVFGELNIKQTGTGITNNAIFLQTNSVLNVHDGGKVNLLVGDTASGRSIHLNNNGAAIKVAGLFDNQTEDEVRIGNRGVRALLDIYDEGVFKTQGQLTITGYSTLKIDKDATAIVGKNFIMGDDNTFAARALVDGTLSVGGNFSVSDGYFRAFAADETADAAYKIGNTYFDFVAGEDSVITVGGNFSAGALHYGVRGAFLSFAGDTEVTGSMSISGLNASPAGTAPALLVVEKTGTFTVKNTASAANALFISNDARLEVKGRMDVTGLTNLNWGSVLVDGGTFKTTTLTHNANGSSIWLKDGGMLAVTGSSSLDYGNALRTLMATGTVQFANADYLPTRTPGDTANFDKAYNQTLYLADNYVFKAVGAATVYANIDANNKNGAIINFANETTAGNLAFFGTLSNYAANQSVVVNNNLNVSGGFGKLTLDDVSIKATNTLTTFTFNNASADNTTEIKGAITGAGVTTGSAAVAFDGGTFHLTGDGSSYNGTTSVNTGTVLLVESNYTGATGNWTVHGKADTIPGATLGGHGKIGGHTTIKEDGRLLLQGAEFHGGLLVETNARLNIATGGETPDLIVGNLKTLEFGDSIVLELGGTEEDWLYDGMQLNDGLTLFFIDLKSGASLAAINQTSQEEQYLMDVFVSLDIDFELEVYNSLARGGFPTLQLGYQQMGDDLARVYVAGLYSIPEPSTWLLLGLGTAVLVIFRRRKKD